MSLLHLPSGASLYTALLAFWPELSRLVLDWPPVQRLTQDSREVRAGDAFFALPGVHQSGCLYQEAARQQGASLLLREGPLAVEALDSNCWQLQLPALQKHLGALLAQAAGTNFKSLRTLAVTGTNGKSSVAHFMCQLYGLLQEEKAALVGTLGYGELHQLEPASHTTPDLFRLHQLYQQWGAQGITRVCLEASSHALDQGRLDGIPIHTALLTNLSRDHLDYHLTLEAYAQAKSRLFQRPELAWRILNQETALGRQLAAQASPAQKLTYSLDAAADLWVSQWQVQPQGIAGRLHWQQESAPFTLPFLGRFNLANALAAVGALLAEGYPLAALASELARLQPVPGRMQLVPSPAGVPAPTLVVDYAHTPEALREVLQAVREHTQGRLFCVLGCGGNRDQGKRPLMAEVAGRLADQLIVTDDNPRDEDPAVIRQALLAAWPAAHEEADRATAIAWAVAQAGPDDSVLLAGKGHEDYQEYAGQRFPFSDLQVARDLLAQKASGEVQ